MLVIVSRSDSGQRQSSLRAAVSKNLEASDASRTALASKSRMEQRVSIASHQSLRIPHQPSSPFKCQQSKCRSSHLIWAAGERVLQLPAFPMIVQRLWDIRNQELWHAVSQLEYIPRSVYPAPCEQRLQKTFTNIQSHLATSEALKKRRVTKNVSTTAHLCNVVNAVGSRAGVQGASISCQRSTHADKRTPIPVAPHTTQHLHARPADDLLTLFETPKLTG